MFIYLIVYYFTKIFFYKMYTQSLIDKKECTLKVFLLVEQRYSIAHSENPKFKCKFVLEQTAVLE